MARPDLYLPSRFVTWLAPFPATFSRRSHYITAALATGAVLAVGPRTVTNCLRALAWPSTLTLLLSLAYSNATLDPAWRSRVCWCAWS